MLWIVWQSDNEELKNTDDDGDDDGDDQHDVNGVDVDIDDDHHHHNWL